MKLNFHRICPYFNKFISKSLFFLNTFILNVIKLTLNVAVLRFTKITFFTIKNLNFKIIKNLRC